MITLGIFAAVPWRVIGMAPIPVCGCLPRAASVARMQMLLRHSRQLKDRQCSGELFCAAMWRTRIGAASDRLAACTRIDLAHPETTAAESHLRLCFAN